MSAAADIACREMVELITDYLEGALPRAERRRFRRHLDACDGCATYVEQMRQTIAMVGRIEPAEMTPAARDAMLHTFRDWQAAR
jgi:anti-sigma factor RsiW